MTWLEVFIHLKEFDSNVLVCPHSNAMLLHQGIYVFVVLRLRDDSLFLHIVQCQLILYCILDQLLVLNVDYDWHVSTQAWVFHLSVVELLSREAKY